MPGTAAWNRYVTMIVVVIECQFWSTFLVQLCFVMTMTLVRISTEQFQHGVGEIVLGTKSQQCQFHGMAIEGFSHVGAQTYVGFVNKPRTRRCFRVFVVFWFCLFASSVRVRIHSLRSQRGWMSGSCCDEHLLGGADGRAARRPGTRGGALGRRRTHHPPDPGVAGTHCCCGTRLERKHQLRMCPFLSLMYR